MRHFVALGLIVCGTLLALAPVASEFLQRDAIAEMAAQQVQIAPMKFVAQPLEESYRLGAWVLGAAMIGLGIIGSWRYATTSRQSSGASAERYLTRAAG